MEILRMRRKRGGFGQRSVIENVYAGRRDRDRDRDCDCDRDRDRGRGADRRCTQGCGRTRGAE